VTKLSLYAVVVLVFFCGCSDHKPKRKSANEEIANSDKKVELVDTDGKRHELKGKDKIFLIDLLSKNPDSDYDEHMKLDPMYRFFIGDIDYALEPDRVILMHKNGTKIWKSPGVRNRILGTLKSSK